MTNDFKTNLVDLDNKFNTFEEFIRTERVKTRFGIKRGTLYNLHNRREVKGVLLRQRGNLTGVRLWSVKSIQDYIQSQMAGEDGDVQVRAE